jgi:hypothetical protein
MELSTRGTTANLIPYKPGQSGNPTGVNAGRPVGSRTTFSRGFAADLAEVWAEHGKATMVETATKQPVTFFAVCSRLIGPEVKITIEQSLPGGLSPADWQIMSETIAAIKEVLPDAGNRQPGEVLQLVTDAVRAFTAAPTIEG